MNNPDDPNSKAPFSKDKTTEELKAVLSLAPEILSATVLAKWQTFSDSTWSDLSSELRRQTKALRSNDLSRAEDMLFAQAHTLDGLFATLAARAAAAPSVTILEVYLRLALKAQNQSRATLQTLGELKAPKQVAFVKQANIGNQVQVNNGTDANRPPVCTRTRKSKRNTPNKLLEVDHEQRLDTRAQSAASPINTTVETVGAKHRPTHRRGQERDRS